MSVPVHPTHRVLPIALVMLTLLLLNGVALADTTVSLPGSVRPGEEFLLNITLPANTSAITVVVGIVDPASGEPVQEREIPVGPAASRNISVPVKLDREEWMSPGSNNITLVVRILGENGTIATVNSSIALELPGALHVSLVKSTLALIPLVVVFVGILVFKLSSRYVAPFVLLVVTVPIALLAFREGSFVDSLERIGVVIGYSISWGMLDYVYSIFGAFFFLEALKSTGALMFIKDDFKRISNDRQHLVLLIGFCFAMIIAVVAPAGSNFVIAAMMLLSLGFNRYGVGMICLFGNSISSVFGLLGIAIVALAEVTDLELLPLSGMIGMFMVFLTILTPLWMNIIYTRKGPIKDLMDPDLREDVILLLVMGGVYAGVQLLVAWFLGPELPTILAGIATLLVVVVVEKTYLERRLKKRMKSYGKRPRTVNPLEWLLMVVRTRSYYIPFVIMIVLLLFIRLVVPWIGPLEWAISLLDVPLTFSLIHRTVTFNILTSPGTLVILSTLSIPILRKNWPPRDKVRVWKEEESARPSGGGSTRVYERCPNCDEPVDPEWKECPICEEILVEDAEGYARMRIEREGGAEAERVEPTLLRSSLTRTSRTMVPILISISCFIAIANVMKYFGMTTSLAGSIIYLIGDNAVIYVIFIPVIGMLGSGLTGSTTTSNVLFGALHVEAASRLGLSALKVSAAQVLGSTTGEMISPMNAVVVAAAVGLKDRESLLIRRMLPSFALWLAICIVTTLFFIYVV